MDYEELYTNIMLGIVQFHDDSKVGSVVFILLFIIVLSLYYHCTIIILTDFIFNIIGVGWNRARPAQSV